MSERKDELKEVIIKGLSKRIAEEINEKLNVPIGHDIDGNIIVEVNKKVVDYLIGELAEKRFMYGLELKKEPKDW